jgi:hypothetical protein
MTTTTDDDGTPDPQHGDLRILAHLLTPTEAHMLASCLRAAGIPAHASDTSLVQAQPLWFNALGGARVRVPEALFSQAQGVVAALERGDFALDDDFDVGESPPTR